MADFCTTCAERMGLPVDIEVKKIFDTIDKGMYREGFLCEGCTLVAIGKSEDGKEMVLGSLRDTEWLPEKDFYEKHNYI